MVGRRPYFSCYISGSVFVHWNVHGRRAMDVLERRFGLSVGVAGAVILAVAFSVYRYRHEPLTEITGVVLRQDKDPANQPPVANVVISLSDGLASGDTRSDANGLFHLKLREGVRAGQIATLILEHSDFQTAKIFEILQNQLYVVHIVPKAAQPTKPQTISNVKIRYSLRTSTVEGVGSIAKKFEVVNRGNVACHRGMPCSPDRRWKAAIGGITLDAVDDSEFRNARVTCIAGPCPFTRIEKDGFSKGGRKLSVTIRNWSDTASFLLEADVTRAVDSQIVRQAFPVTMNQVLSFTLPAVAQGPSVEATVNGEDIVYPLGPDLKLSWATCAGTTTGNQTKLFRCDLKPGYQFR